MPKVTNFAIEVELMDGQVDMKHYIHPYVSDMDQREHKSNSNICNASNACLLVCLLTCLLGWLVGWWLVGRLVGCVCVYVDGGKGGWLVGWLVFRLFGCLVGWLVCSFTGPLMQTKKSKGNLKNKDHSPDKFPLLVTHDGVVKLNVIIHVEKTFSRALRIVLQNLEHVFTMDIARPAANKMVHGFTAHAAVYA